MSEKYMLGCNYWDSASGTDMWKNWNPDVVEKDLAALEECGVKYLRVFPNWRDFQPIRKLYAAEGTLGEYVVGEDYGYLDENPEGMDYDMLAHFREFAKIAAAHGMKLIVSIVTGWMSGRLFVPPALEGRNTITDPEALMWTEKYVRATVRNLRDLDNIVVWDLGNECNCMGKATSRAEAYLWAATVRNAIKSEDTARPISSGMHSLTCEPMGIWNLHDQGELCDMMTTHPYPSPTIKGDIEPYNGLRTTMLPTAQSEYYAGVSGKPCIIQESGTFSPTIGNDMMAADFVRVNILSSWANKVDGYLWWCGMEHLLLDKPPYSWSMIERQLGMVNLERKPKPVGETFKRMSRVIYSLPAIKSKRYDAVCVLSRTEKQATACSAYILAKQAGFNLKPVNCEHTIPNSRIYLVPCVAWWQVMYKRTYDFLIDKVKNDGASLIVTYNGGHFTQFEEFFGVRSHGIYKSGKKHTAHFSFGDIDYVSEHDLQLEPLSAEVLARNEEGNPIFTVNAYGKGKIYFLGFPVEKIAFDSCCGFDSEKTQDYCEIYREFGKEIIASYRVQCDEPDIGITELTAENGKLVVCAVNYSDRPRKFAPNIKGDFKLLYGSLSEIPACDATIIEFED